MILGQSRVAKKAAVRQSIINAALKLFCERGFDSTTVEELAVAADVSRRTFFRYFETKEAAFFANHEHRLLIFRERIKVPQKGEGPEQTVMRVCLEMAGMYMSERDVALAQHVTIESSKSLKAYDQRLDADWEEAIREVLQGTDPLEALVLAGAIIGGVRAVLREWFLRGAEDNLVEMGEAAFRIIGVPRGGQLR